MLQQDTSIDLEQKDADLNQGPPSYATTGQTLPRCRECGSKQLRRTAKGAIDSVWACLFSQHPYVCGRCNASYSRYQFTWLTVWIWLFIFASFAGILYRVVPIAMFRTESAAPNAGEALARARISAGGQLSNFEQMMIRKPRLTLDNATILQLKKANVSTNLLIQMIRTSTPDFDLSANAIVELKQAQLDESVIMTMIDTSYNAR